MSISILGAGAFGTGLAISMARGGADVTLWARNRDAAEAIERSRQNPRLPDVDLPAGITVTSDLAQAAANETVLLCVPMQQLHGFLADHHDLLAEKSLVACCKGVDLATLTGATALIESLIPGATPAILTGPSFASDIARGLPTALTLACADTTVGATLQEQLSTLNLRIYRTTDTAGAELGGALKNVVAIACGVAIGAKLGESARAAVMTRGYAEMQRLAQDRGALPETLAGLSGFGDLTLTCTSEQSRNYRFGLSLGRGESFDPAVTVEGAATAKAVSNLAKKLNIDLPIANTVTALIDGELTVSGAVETLLSRPLRKE
ncbi:NAD(P)H-dependent glycerol-3-phosphate dehydrogenase [Aliiroseovarius sp. YM-037]|uniref:NAD(P)H-dependent glycerol-3-phosphate dehydrogenase n=1 Tax=Aliiroseovarius sp. YM-037 TaxID=3341728 RepID=UPI003A7FE26E